MAEQKFYLTVYRVEVLTMEPISSTEELPNIIVGGMVGEKYSIRTEQTEQETINGSAASKIMLRHGNNPEFFGLALPGEEDGDGDVTDVGV